MPNLFKSFTGAMGGFFKNLTKSGRREIMTLNELIDFLNLSGVPRGKLSEATYFACLKILSESVGKLPLHLMQHQKNGGVDKARDHPLYFILKTRPNPYMTSTSFWATVEINRNHYGNAYVLINNLGSPKDTTLWILDPTKVRVWWDDAKMLSTVSDVWYLYHAPDGKTYKFSSSQILHFKTSTSFDGITGLSVSEILATTLKGAQKAQDLVNKMYETGFVAKAVVQYTGGLNDENAKIFSKQIEDFALGKDEDLRAIIPLPYGAQLNPLNMKFTDAEYMAVRKHTALQIAAAFGIKPNQINDYEKASYASAEAQQLAFYVDTLLFILKQYEEETTFKLLGKDECAKKGLHWKFNVSVILRADQKTQIETLRMGVAGFIYTPNEARAMLDKPALPGGDQLVGNGSTIPLTKVGDQYPAGGGESINEYGKRNHPESSTGGPETGR
ncbi:phage portal protein [Ruminococcaceae bacterium OttesenSCG-928-I18]|nr:phage portal protein [Ruminococcaceae bacterium OttesenSCG-928-I18]